MGGHSIFLGCVNLHPASRRLNELRFARRIEVVAASRRPLRWRQIAPMLAAILLAVPAVYAQTGSKVIPIRIAAGESVTLERAAAKGDEVFELRAKAGQTLASRRTAIGPLLRSWTRVTFPVCGCFVRMLRARRIYPTRRDLATVWIGVG